MRDLQGSCRRAGDVGDAYCRLRYGQQRRRGRDGALDDRLARCCVPLAPSMLGLCLPPMTRPAPSSCDARPCGRPTRMSGKPSGGRCARRIPPPRRRTAFSRRWPRRGTPTTGWRISCSRRRAQVHPLLAQCSSHGLSQVGRRRAHLLFKVPPYWLAVCRASVASRSRHAPQLKPRARRAVEPWRRREHPGMLMAKRLLAL